jgi:hypothetical protein
MVSAESLSGHLLHPSIEPTDVAKTASGVRRSLDDCIGRLEDPGLPAATRIAVLNDLSRHLRVLSPTEDAEALTRVLDWCALRCVAAGVSPGIKPYGVLHALCFPAVWSAAWGTACRRFGPQRCARIGPSSATRQQWPPPYPAVTSLYWSSGMAYATLHEAS